ncbi:ABC transporter ATP-binding protein [Phycicoccus avicenniae]|uniref:ABC transporter ATP-binding protein n=1 Tax=Phycicoccus avicenniae TaxID=2828860 RepID=UPI003D299F2C
MSGDLLRVHEVHRTFGSGATAVHALRGVSLEVEPGELLALRGRSGSGKTSLLNVIGGLDRPDGGTVHLGEREVTGMSDAELLGLRRGPVSYVFQSFGLVPILTARENVGVPLRLREIDATERERRVAEALEHVGLGGHAEHRPDELSGGQQQRVGLARALVSEPGLLLADEPTGQLDSETGREIMGLIARLAKERTMTTLVTTHDPALLSAADRVLEIADGHLVEG